MTGFLALFMMIVVIQSFYKSWLDFLFSSRLKDMSFTFQWLKGILRSLKGNGLSKLFLGTTTIPKLILQFTYSLLKISGFCR